MGLLGGRYRLGPEIARGGMSLVHRAYDELLDREVAVKILTGADSAGFRSRLRAEARAYGRLNSPRVAHIYDYGETGDAVPYLVMELVDGEPLAQVLAGGAVLPWRRAAGVAAEIAEALAAAHARGLVHRDIKPDNVLLTADGVKLVDFGISAYVGAPDADEAGRLIGTAAYIAPERIADAPVDAPADVYALGVLLYRMLAGRLPYGVADGDLLDAHLRAEPDPLPPVPGLPVALADRMAACLAKDPAARPSAAKLAEDLPRIAVPRPGARLRPPVDPAAADRPATTAQATATGQAAPTTPASTTAQAAATGQAAPTTPASTTGPAAAARRTRAFSGTRVMGAVRAVAAPAVEPGAARGSRWAVAGLGLAGVTLLVTAWATGSPRPPVEEPAVAPVACRATFAVARDWGTGFDARVTVTNTGTDAVDGWRITFDFPTGQRLTSTGTTAVVASSGGHATRPGALRQSGTTVMAAGAGPLPPAQSLTVPITGAYTRVGAIPTQVSLNDRPCATTVSGARSAPTTGAPTVNPAPRHTDPAPPNDDHHGKPKKSRGGDGRG